MKIGALANYSSGYSPEAATIPETGKAADAAKQFESLLIGQMLKTMRESGSGWLGSGEDQTAEPAMAMAEEHFAAALSASGGLGLAATIERGFEKRAVASPAHKLQE